MIKINYWLVFFIILPDFNIVDGEPLRKLYNGQKTGEECDVFSDCVPFERCKSSCDMIFEFSVIQKLKYLSKVRCQGRGSEGKLHVCCEKENALDFTYCSENDDAKELEHATAAQSKLKKDYLMCGTENALDFRIANSQVPATKQHFQWNGILRKKRKEEVICSAVLITKKHLVSAAHCFTESTDYEVVFSLNSINSFQQCVNSADCKSTGCRRELEIDNKCVKFKITEVIKHPRHDRTKKVSNFDIAILTINREVDLIPICLPDLDSFTDLAVSEKVLVAAWSNNWDQPSTEKFELVQGNFSHATNEQCFKKFQENVSVLQMCIESTGPAWSRAFICKGDSGAGAIREKANGWLEIVGITTNGAVSCVSSDQTIFTRISGPILRWVLNQLYQHDIR